MRQHLKFWPALIVPGTALIVLLTLSRCPNQLESNVHKKYWEIRLFVLVFLCLCNYFYDNIPFYIINVVIPDPNIFLWTAVNPNVIKTLLTNGLSTFFIEGNPAFSNGPKSLPKNPPACHILYNWVFDNFILADGPFPKT